MKKMQLAVMAAAICLLSGCSNYEKTYDKNTLGVKKNDSIVEIAVENFEEASVKEEDITAYVEEQIAAYNDKTGKKSVKQKSINTEDLSKVKLVLTYKDLDSYNDFNLLDYKLDDYSNIKETELKGTYTSAENKEVKFKDLENVDKAKVLIVSQATDVVVSGDILYYNKEASVKDGVITTSGEENAIIIFK